MTIKPAYLVLLLLFSSCSYNVSSIVTNASADTLTVNIIYTQPVSRDPSYQKITPSASLLSVDTFGNVASFRLAPRDTLVIEQVRGGKHTPPQFKDIKQLEIKAPRYRYNYPHNTLHKLFFNTGSGVWEWRVR